MTACIKCDPKDWKDSLPVNGYIKTVCGKCGKFIGSRPVEVKKEKPKQKSGIG